jgi:hypothetical protein
MRRFHPQKLEKCIGIPAEQWVSRCHEISALALETGCYTGYLRYGMYLGSIAPECRVAGWQEYQRSGVPIRHGWIEQKSGRIIDPTRWVFTAESPHISIIMPDDQEYQEYDPGAQQFKMLFLTPPPLRQPGDRELAEFQPQGTLLGWVRASLEDTQGPPFTVQQVFWLANLPPRLLGRWAKPLYLALNVSELRGAIPVDYWDLVMQPRRNPDEFCSC